jgi:hypothetical protein
LTGPSENQIELALRFVGMLAKDDLSPDRRKHFAGLLRELLFALKRSSKYTPRTLARAAKIRQLERKMAHMDPRDRAAAICERMRLCRSDYYKLRKIFPSPHANTDGFSV